MARSSKPTQYRGRWRIRWNDHDGKRRSETFDTFDEAESQLRRRKTEAEDVRRGKRLPTPEVHKFQELADYWRTHRMPQKRSARDDESMLSRHLIPAFGDMPIIEIRQSVVDRYIASKLELSPKTVANHLTLLTTMLGLAVDLTWITSAPRIRKPRVKADDVKEQPWLKTDEIERLLRAAATIEEIGDPLTSVPRLMYMTAVYSGMRAGELAGLRWSDVDLERRTIHVRRSYHGETKTRASQRHIPVFDILLPVLRAWKLRCPPTKGDLVFPNRRGRMQGRSFRVFQETLHRVLDTAGFERPTGKAKHVIHFHSLRHTFACHFRLNGGKLEDLMDVLGHTSKTMTQHYANIGGYHRPEHFALFREG